jgi:hypothetical protein
MKRRSVLSVLLFGVTVCAVLLLWSSSVRMAVLRSIALRLGHSTRALVHAPCNATAAVCTGCGAVVCRRS